MDEVEPRRDTDSASPSWKSSSRFLLTFGEPEQNQLEKQNKNRKTSRINENKREYNAVERVMQRERKDVLLVIPTL